MKTVLYFGPIHQSGHYLWADERTHLWEAAHLGLHRRLVQGLDGTFCPPVDEVTGIVQKNVVGHWLILSWWDRSQDTRPNCNSNLIGTGFVDITEMVAAAREKFPAVFKRQKTDLFWPV